MAYKHFEEDFEKQEKVERIIALLKSLTEEERLQIFGHFCNSCGTVQPEYRHCQCWNDE